MSWYLVEGMLPREIQQRGEAFLTLSAGRGAVVDDRVERVVPVLRSGKVSEIVELPSGATDLLWRSTAGEAIELEACSVRGLGLFERIGRMAYRVIGAFVDFPVAECKLMGVTLPAAVFDLPRAYRAATRFRFSWPLNHYGDWVGRFDVLSDADSSATRQHIARFEARPHFHVLILSAENKAEQGGVEVTRASLAAQLYPEFSVGVLDDAAKVDAFLSSGIQAEWLLLLRAGEQLAAHALYWLACEAQAKPEAAVLYCDDDVLDADGQRCAPRFKPDWSLAHFRSGDFVGNAVALRGSAVAAAGGLNAEDCCYGPYDLLLRVVDVVGEQGAHRVVHVPTVLLHRAFTPLFDPLAEGAGEQVKWGSDERAWRTGALRAHLARNGLTGDVSETLPGCWRVRYALPAAIPLVSIIIPTRDALTLIRQCVESLLEKTTYPRLEILVVDNQSADGAALAYLAALPARSSERISVRVLRYDLPFNYSAVNNFAVREARGEVLCLLNNDTEVISPDWLEEMVGHLLQPKVGVVGAKLYFPDGRVQHAGDTVGPGGCANHLHSFIEHDDPGYCKRAAVAQELSAVTAACLITRRDLYLSLGGLNEKALPIAFNDVDYCLRVRKAGHRVVWTPHAELYHHESVSRGKDRSLWRKIQAWREVRYMRRKWREAMRNDPFYNPNFSYARPDFVLSPVPRVKRPWR